MKKTILITGATDGIGKLLAERFAHHGHTLYLHGRSPEKLEQIISDLKNNSENQEIYSFVADFSDLGSVQNMADEIKSLGVTIDILINNAGIYNSPVSKNSNGLDMRFAVNYLAPYLLTEELLPVLEQSTNSRIINLSSAAQAPVSLDALRGKLDISEQSAYAQSKLALTMWSFDFAKKHPNITTVAVNPGSLLNTKMANEAFGQHWSPAEKGVDILYELSLGSEHQNNSGKYFDNDAGKFGEAHGDAYNDELIRELLRVTQETI